MGRVWSEEALPRGEGEVKCTGEGVFGAGVCDEDELPGRVEVREMGGDLVPFLKALKLEYGRCDCRGGRGGIMVEVGVRGTR